MVQYLFIGLGRQSKFHVPLIKLLKKDKIGDGVHFLFLGGDETTYSNYKDEVTQLKSDALLTPQLIRALLIVLRARNIVFNGLNYQTVPLIFFLLLAAFKKTHWIVWGADLYGKRESISGYIFGKLLNRINTIGFCTPGDRNYFEKMHKVTDNCKLTEFWFPYDESVIAAMKNLKVNSCHKKQEMRVMIGNSADKSNDHLSVLQKLGEIRHANIEIILPLSYGDKAYADRVVDFAYDIFGSTKVIPLTNFMEQSEYVKFLNTVDVAIFPARRQQAGQTILILNALRKKVYISHYNSYYSLLVQDNENILSFEEMQIKALPNSHLIEHHQQRDFKYLGSQYALEKIQRFLMVLSNDV